MLYEVITGSVPKDGPSAGVTLTTSLISAFTNLEVSSNMAMTGEIRITSYNVCYTKLLRIYCNLYSKW